MPRKRRKAGYNASFLGYSDTSLNPHGQAATGPRFATYSGVLPGFRQIEPGSESALAWARHPSLEEAAARAIGGAFTRVPGSGGVTWVC